MIGLGDAEVLILRTYLFGDAGVASVPKLLSSQRIRIPQDGHEVTAEIDIRLYMDRSTGAGRFATGNMFNIINLFFAPFSNVNVSQPGANNNWSFLNYERAFDLAPGRYTKAQLAVALGGIDNYSFDMQQYGFADEAVRQFRGHNTN